MINFPFYYAAINTSINTSSNNKYILCSWYNTIWFNPVWFNPVWHDRVYLCYEDTKLKNPNTYSPIYGFICNKYDSFENANSGWYNDHTELHPLNIRHTLIPICKWVPSLLDKYILDWKLNKIYWIGKHTLGHGYNFKK